MELKLNLDESSSNRNNNYNSNNNENELNRNMFEFIYVIGKGGFGKVWKVQYKKTKEYFALKEMSKRKIIDKKSEKSINSEREFLSKLHNPFIVNMHYAFQDNDNLYLVMDMLSGGDLRYHCSRYRIFSEEQTRFFIACIIYSLEYIHSNNVIHRDIKPENLVLDEKGYVRITDFGIAKENMLDNSSETSGTPGYMSPEVMNGKNHSFQADFFAIGVIGYEFLMGIRPFNGKNRKEIKEKMFGERVVINQAQMKKGWSIEGADFINQLLERNQEKRLGAKGGVIELKRHQWLKYYPWEELENKKLPAPFIPEQIDNFDKSYCESIEKISEETKIRYNEIYLSSKYKEAFVDFYYNKDSVLFQRKAIKSQRIHINKDKINDLINKKRENLNNIEDRKINNVENKSMEEKKIISLGSSNTEREQISFDNNKSEEKNENENNTEEDIKNDNKEKSVEKETEKEKQKFNGINDDIIEQKINNLKHYDMNFSPDNKILNKSNNVMNYYQSNDMPKFKKIIANNSNNHIKKTNEDTFLKDYIKYQYAKKQNELKQKNNYLLKAKNRENNNNNVHSKINSNFNKNKKSSSLISFSPRIGNKNNQIDYIEYTKKYFENNKVRPFQYGCLNNNSKSHFLLKKKQNFKKKNNSFRINHAKNINYKFDKVNMKKIFNIQSLYNHNENKSNINIHTNNLDQKFMHKKLIGFDFSDEKRYIKKYINNMNCSNINNSDNFGLNKSNNIRVKKLFSPNSKSKSNITNFPKNENNFNFKGKIAKFKLSGNSNCNNNNMPYQNYLSNAVGFSFKNFERTYSCNDYKNAGNKTIKSDKKMQNNNSNSVNRKHKSCSNNKNKIPFYISS